MIRICESRKRKNVVNDIKELYQAVKKVTPPFLENPRTLRIHAELLDIKSQGDETSAPEEGCFFSPLSEKQYSGFSFVENAENAWRTTELQVSMDPQLSEGTMADAQDMFLSFAWLASSAERHRMSEDGQTFTGSLGNYNGWSGQEGFLKYVVDRGRFAPDLLNIHYSLCGYWTRLTDAEPKPHIMLAMAHNVAGDEKLLKGDVLAVLAALQSRMDCAELQKHMVIPVMLFSFMGYHAKIIQAYHNGEELIVRQSPLFKFDDYEKAPIDVFLRYMASEAVGDTTKFPQQKPVETQQTRDASKRDTLKKWSTFSGRSKRLPISNIFTTAKDSEAKMEVQKAEKGQKEALEGNGSNRNGSSEIGSKEKESKGGEGTNGDSKNENGNSKEKNGDPKEGNGDSNGKKDGSPKD